MAYTQSNYPLYASCYAFGFGVVDGGSYMVALYHSWAWFPNHGGLVTGILVSSVGLSAIVFEQISLKIVNPNNIQAVDGVFPPEVT